MSRWRALAEGLLGGLLGGLLIVLSLAACSYPLLARGATPDIPHQANRYRQDLTRQARLVWGLDAPVALLAAQIHQESAWNPRAVSPVGAQGLAQFMPATATWMGDIDRELRGADAFNPTWSFRAVARYDYWLIRKIKAESSCDVWAMVLSSYNGGLGWVIKDRAKAADHGLNRNRWWGHVELVNAGRSQANFRENRGYPKRILLTLLPRYAQAGWGEPVCL